MSRMARLRIRINRHPVFVLTFKDEYRGVPTPCATAYRQTPTPRGAMSLSEAIALIVVLDVALLGFVAWMMSHPRRLTPHVSQRESPVPRERRFFKEEFAREAESQPDSILERNV